MQAAIREFSIFKAKQGVFSEARCLSQVSAMPHYQWWQQFGGAVPHLQWFATRITAMIGNTHSAEGGFSKLKYLKHSRRNRLTQQRTVDLMWVQSNLALKEKIRDVNYMETPVRQNLYESLLQDELEEVLIEDTNFWTEEEPTNSPQ